MEARQFGRRKLFSASNALYYMVLNASQNSQTLQDVSPEEGMAMTMSSQKEYENRKLYVEEKHAKSYAHFRPTYPDVVYETIFNFCKNNATGTSLALDIGCGSGQSTLPLVKYFSKVIGIDVSPAQISNAPTDVSGVTFHVSSAEELGVVKDESVDLITVAEALHWMQLDKFYAEVDRVLKPGGSIVVYGYDMMVADHTETSNYIMDMYKVGLAKYRPKDIKRVDKRYSSLPSPYSEWVKIDDLVIEKHWTPAHIVGFVDSWTSCQIYKKDNPNSDLLSEIQEKLSLFCRQDGRKTFKATFPVFMLMTHKPRSTI